MYVPPYDVILNALGLSPLDIEADRPVTIPAQLFRFFLEGAVAQGAFDERYYLTSNPDVKEAVSRGRIENARSHYVGFGYFENRRGGTPPVDESWYLRTYPDVASAIRTGRVGSATEHFETTGALEWRAPQVEMLQDAQLWKAVCSSREQAARRNPSR